MKGLEALTFALPASSAPLRPFFQGLLDCSATESAMSSHQEAAHKDPVYTAQSALLKPPAPFEVQPTGIVRPLWKDFARSAEADLRVIQHQLEQHVSVSLDVVCVACQHLLVSRQVRLQLLPHQVIALLLLEVHCRAQQPSLP